MINYLIRRLGTTLITVLVLSYTIFAIVQIPPGDAVDRQVRLRQTQGDVVTREEIETLRAQYGLDRPILVRYYQWIRGFLVGDLGRSTSGRRVNDLIAERLPQTVALAVAGLIITYAIGIPVGIYSATHQYSAGDYIANSISFIGMSVPGFLIGIILLYLFYKWFGLSIGGFFSVEYKSAPWSWARLQDLINHLWVPLFVVAVGSTGGLIRTMRATLLDELSKQYVMTARAKGVPMRKLLLKYPVRLALNPIIASIGHIFPYLLSGQVVIAIVLNLPVLGPLLNTALTNEDIALSSSILLIQSLLAVFGTVVSDVLLAVLDPRIRFERGAH
ncbi:MAG: ABC transporter permease [Chloroflexi bacterium]|nr:ABC transporter permease [Chloroflexota bacterium]